MDLSSYIWYCWCSFLTSYGWVFGWFRKLFHYWNVLNFWIHHLRHYASIDSHFRLFYSLLLPTSYFRVHLLQFMYRFPIDVDVFALQSFYIDGMLPTHLHVYCLYTVFLHRTLCLNGWETVNSMSKIFLKRLMKKFPALFLLTKLIPYVAHEVKTMRTNHLDESNQNFLYICRYFVFPGNRFRVTCYKLHFYIL